MATLHNSINQIDLPLCGFTPSQVDYIKQLIDERIGLKKSLNNNSSHHSLPEIRQLILVNQETLKARFNGQVFTVAVFQFALSEHTNLREGDKVLMGETTHCYTRWHQQVGNVLAGQWPKSQAPIIKVGGENGAYRGVYRFAD